MSVREFRDNDDGYLAWLASHPDGYVLNIARSYNPVDGRVHHARCASISGQKRPDSALTEQYAKVCAEHLTELERWITDHVRTSIPPCRKCHQAERASRTDPTKRTEQGLGAAAAEGRYTIDEPSTDSPVVQAWADDYIRFERRPAWQETLRNEIRVFCRQLEPSAGQILHATFCGPKRPDADVENLALYNIDAFKVAGRNGIRFE